MSKVPPGGPGGPPPPYYGYPSTHPPPPGSYAYVPTPVMMPVPVYQPPPPPQQVQVDPSFLQPTYVTNHYYQQPPDPVHVVDKSPMTPPTVYRQPVHITNYIYEAPAPPPNRVPQYAPPVPQAPADQIDWMPTTSHQASAFAHRAVVAGREGWDSSPLWVIRAFHSGELVPGKLVIKHRSAYIPHAGKEVPVHNFEVMCAPHHAVRWLPSSNGQVPMGAIVAGNTHGGEPLYVGRAKHMRSLTPGKVHATHGCCYISFGGSETAHKHYEVLCRV